MTQFIAWQGGKTAAVLALLLLPLVVLAGCDTQYHLRGIVLDAPDGPPRFPSSMPMIPGLKRMAFAMPPSN